MRGDLKFTKNLRALMDIRDITSGELSLYTGIGLDTINSYLKFKGALPRADKAVLIAEALETSVESLITGDGKPEPRRKSVLTEKRRDEILKTLSGLSEESLSKVEAFIRDVAAEDEEKKSPKEENDSPVEKK